jgi:hypothetical protein
VGGPRYHVDKFDRDWFARPPYLDWTIIDSIGQAQYLGRRVGGVTGSVGLAVRKPERFA